MHKLKSSGDSVSLIKHGLPQNITLIGLAIVSVIGFLVYRDFVIIELGIIGFVADLLYELYGTAKGWWSYDFLSIYVIAGRLPIEIPLAYFFMGASAVVFVLFRLGI
ncbi:MAG: hypothetical protein J4451_00605 [DPANN group archaeon]|nr:hypothetical protein [DPANN group archaeon]